MVQRRPAHQPPPRREPCHAESLKAGGQHRQQPMLVRRHSATVRNKVAVPLQVEFAQSGGPHRPQESHQAVVLLSRLLVAAACRDSQPQVSQRLWRRAPPGCQLASHGVQGGLFVCTVLADAAFGLPAGRDRACRSFSVHPEGLSLLVPAPVAPQHAQMAQAGGEPHFNRPGAAVRSHVAEYEAGERSERPKIGRLGLTVEITEVTALQVQHAQTAAGRNCCFQDTNPGLPLIRPLVAVVVLGVVQIGRYEHLKVWEVVESLNQLPAVVQKHANLQ
mmetsp:Transcript_5005/g.14400  ORF Transcript_5005/g.14400 Transcript_5005/m.14400 type:complete len:276 (+) Transcript_5005:1152-1979(+)